MVCATFCTFSIFLFHYLLITFFASSHNMRRDVIIRPLIQYLVAKQLVDWQNGFLQLLMDFNSDKSRCVSAILNVASRSPAACSLHIIVIYMLLY